MNLRILARHMRLTETLREYVRRRFLGALPRHYDRDSCELRVEIEHGTGHGTGGNKYRFEEVRARLAVPGAVLVAHARAADVYSAIDLAERQLVHNLDGWREKGRDLGRFPKKFHTARLVEEGRMPAMLPEGAAVQPDPIAREHESGSSPTPLRPPAASR